MSRNTNPDIESSVTCGFFNSLNGDRKYNANQMSTIFDGVINDGIFEKIGNKFIVRAVSGNTVSVDTGKAWFNSTWTINDAILNIDCGNAEILQDRIDAIVIEIDKTDNVRDNFIKVVKGTASSNPSRPVLKDGTEKVWQYALAYILRPANSQSIIQANITNMIGSEATPFITSILQLTSTDQLVLQWQAQLDDFVASETADFTEWSNNQKTTVTNWITEQQASFMNWFSNIQDTLSGDVAGNLQTQIDNIMNNINEIENSEIDAIL